MIVAFITSIELDRVCKDSPYEPHSFFGTVKQEIEKWPLRR
jgi:hypothetical protein